MRFDENFEGCTISVEDPGINLAVPESISSMDEIASAA
jgi:hypothetical protein